MTPTTTTTPKSPEPESETPTRIQPAKPISFSNGIIKRHHLHHHHHHHSVLAVAYKECLKNHAAALGGHALDGCGEFMPSPSSNPSDPTSLKCAACGCHRNFHRREPDDSSLTSAAAVASALPSPHPSSAAAIEYQPHHRHHPPPPAPPPPPGHSRSPNSASPPPISSSYMLLALSGTNNNTGNSLAFSDLNFAGNNLSTHQTPGSRKRFRTKFSQYQKEKMHEFAERVGWKMQKRDEEEIRDFCREIGVDKGVLKVWMHNNKNTFNRRDPFAGVGIGRRSDNGGNNHSTVAPTETNNNNDDDNNNNNNNTAEIYETQRHPFERNRAEDVATSFQQLSIENDNREASSEDDKPAVIIPNHLQIHTSDCLHLRFGSFGSGMGSGLPSAFPPGSLNDNLEEIPEAADDSSIRPPDTRDAEFFGDDERLRNAADENMAYHIDSSARNYDSASDSETDPLKQETPEPAQENEYNKFSSATGYAFDNSQQLNPELSPPEPGPQMQNLRAFPDVMQAYTNSLPSTLLPSTIRDVRESDLQYSPFPANQSMPPQFSNTSLTGPSISMAEALRAANISTPQTTQQTTPGANAAGSPAALAQHLAMHPYSQPALPLGHYANMISYPFLPQSYTYMPSAFQQGFAGNSTYHQSLAAMLPQYKSNNLPQSAPVPSAYGFGTSSNIPGGNFQLNPSSVANSTMSYDDVLSSQFKDSNHLASLQQNENSPAWLQGQNSRMLSAVPGNTYYSFPGQNQQPPGFRQGQQQPPSQHFGSHGYLSPYHSQAGMSLDHNHHQQNPRDASLAQGHASKQTQQLWQNSY